MKFAERVNRIKPSPTFAAAAKVAAMRAKGIEVISFAQGEPDFDTPDNIKEAAYKAIRDGITKYTPASGFPDLKDAIIQKFKRDNNLAYDRSQVFASAGAKLIIYNLAQALFQTGDEVIVPAPYWVSYTDIVLLMDATPVVIPTSEEQGFKSLPAAAGIGGHPAHQGHHPQQPLQSHRRDVHGRGAERPGRGAPAEKDPHHHRRYL